MATDNLVAQNETISGLDALETATRQKVPGRAARIWSLTWPKLTALALVLAVWQALVWAEWRPEYALPAPLTVAQDFWAWANTSALWEGLLITLRRAAYGFGASVVVGLVLGSAVARIKVLRAALGSMITALQTMPSIAWFPLAILLFQLNEQAIFFVVVLGAAPSIANGVIHGVDYVPPLLVRAGRNLGARGFSLYRYVIAPAALPAIVAGLKQGWAFAWRSLMAGELLVIISKSTSIGVQLTFARDFSDAPRVISVMILILILGLVVDLVFTKADQAIRRRWGLLDRH